MVTTIDLVKIEVDGYKSGYSLYVMVLQTQALKVGQEKESCIRVNTRELNRELCTRLSTLYTNI